jgi:2'-5' RNA ligase
MNKTRRLFVGIPLSPPLRKRLKKEMLSWPKEAVLQTAEDNLHVTLMFLGFVHEEDVPEMCAKVGEVCEMIPSFELSFTGMELQDSDEQPKTIQLRGEPSEELKGLREALEKTFSAFITEKKAYRPHITLAKIKKSKWLKLEKKPVLKETLALIEPVDTVAVFESLAIDGKRRYEQIDTFPLQ